MNLVGSVQHWYQQAARDLPWRSPDCTPWGVVVSEVMLQQTQVDRVRPKWEAWMQRWPEPADLAAASLDDVLRMWDRLGYPRRARWLWEAAQQICAEFDGVVPADEAALRSLPGIGSYTAAAVCAFAFGQRTIVLDTNVRRVLARAVDGCERPPTHITQAERAMAEQLLPDQGAAEWSVAVMELGALICTVQNPACDTCPIANHCAWRAAGYPTSDAPRRRTAPYAGSLRAARGAVLAALRETPATRSQLTSHVSNADQLDQALASLLDDGLISALDREYRLGS